MGRKEKDKVMVDYIYILQSTPGWETQTACTAYEDDSY